MKRMSRSLVCGAAVLFPLAALAVGAPNQKQPFTLTLAAPKEPLKAGQPLILRVTVANTSDRGFMVPVSQGSPDVERIYRLHILDERGLTPPRAPLPKPKGGKGFVIRLGSGQGRRLNPGESVVDEVNISHVYDLSRPGKYKIWIAEPFYGGPHNVPKGLVRSNSITVTVVK
jgi:hypothetical protein